MKRFRSSLQGMDRHTRSSLVVERSQDAKQSLIQPGSLGMRASGDIRTIPSYMRPQKRTTFREKKSADRLMQVEEPMQSKEQLIQNSIKNLLKDYYSSHEPNDKSSEILAQKIDYQDTKLTQNMRINAQKAYR